MAWDEPTHAYGAATDVPGLLRKLAGPDRAEAAEALALALGRPLLRSR